MYTCIMLHISYLVVFTPFKNLTQHDFDRLYFFCLGFLFIKLDDISLESLFICLLIDALFVRVVSLGHMQGSKLGVMSKKKVAKLIGLYGKCMLCQVLGCMHAYPLPIHCTEILWNFSALNGQWVPTRAFIHKRKAQNLTMQAFPIQSDQFCNFSFLILPPI